MFLVTVLYLSLKRKEKNSHEADVRLLGVSATKITMNKLLDVGSCLFIEVGNDG